MVRETPWYTCRFAGFDLETTGIDPHTDRIVTAAVLDIDGAGAREAVSRGWLLDPGVPIPDGAVEVHGVTTDYAQEHGQDAAEGVADIARTLLDLSDSGAIIVAYNASYDLTMLAAEADRHGHTELAERVRGVRPVVDPKVLDKKVDRYRRGSRRLVDVAKHYGVKLSEEDAHGADADALAAVRVAYKIGNGYEWIGRLSPGRLHDLQVEWAAEQDAGLKAYWERIGDPRADTITTGWPILTTPADGQA
ncbi:exonuclease domain-containing protein [Nocardiopsis rhodophaea]|uniref:exonuclease domain-containing protein n=1 Tax=Nocardiopsis rhodophaea TaxID=280238 RepID=UPI0031E2E1B7